MKSGVSPSSETGLLARIGDALDMSPSRLADTIGVPRADVKDAWDIRRRDLGGVATDALWIGVIAMVNTQLGALLAIREEIQGMLQLEAAETLLRREQVSHGKR